MLKINQFIRKFCVRKKADMKETKKLSNLGEWPVGSVLHVDTNFDHEGSVSPVPDADSPILQLDPANKIMYLSPMSPPPQSLITPDMSGINVLSHGIKAAVNEFIQSRADYRAIYEIDKLPESAARQAVISYNHLHNVRITGKGKTTKLFKYWASMLLNNISRLSDRVNIIAVPIQDIAFSYTEFKKSIQDPDNHVKMSYPASMSYHILIHLMALTDKKTEENSIFSTIPDKFNENIFIVLTAGDNAVSYNLRKFRELSEGAGFGRYFIDHVTRIRPLTEDAYEPLRTTPSASINQTVAADADDILNNLDEREYLTQNDIEFFRNANELIVTEKLGRIIAVLTGGENVKIDDEVKALLEQIRSTAKVRSRNVAAFSGYPAFDTETTQNQQTIELENRVNRARERIEENENLTPAQKRAMRRNIENWKNLNIETPDGESLNMEELLNQPPVVGLEENSLDFLQDQIADPSLLNSKIYNMDQQYMEKQFHRDLARMVMSFDDMHPTDISVDRTDNSLNRIDKYSIAYLDDNMNKHTIKFSVPVPDKNGYCLINGVGKLMTKQRMNNPICKVSPSRVTLNSNWNKTIVERHEAVAYSFYPHLIRILKKGEYDVEFKASYPFAKPPYLKFSEDELDGLSSRYNHNKRIYTIRVDKEGERWEGFEGTHVGSDLGDLLLVEKKTVKDIKQYEHYKVLTDDQKKQLQGYNKYIIMQLLPSSSDFPLPYEYTQIAKRVSHISGHGVNFRFEYYNRFEGLSPERALEMYELEKSNLGAVYVGTYNDSPCLINEDWSLRIIHSDGVDRSTFLNLVTEASGQRHKPMNEWLKLKILNKDIPIGFVMAYRFGLKNLLEYMKAKPSLFEKGKKPSPAPKTSDIVMKFSDATLVIYDPSNIQRMILCGLNRYSLDCYLEEMNERDIYYTLMESSGLNINYLKGIDTFFNMFVDPQTEDVLRQMGEPTTVKGILVRCAELLVSEDYNSPSSTANTRIRSYDRLLATAYNELSQAYSTYKYGSRGATDKFSINPEAVLARVMTDQLMNNYERVNPVQDFKNRTSISHTGFGGRSDRTFVVKDRQYTEDSIGVISEGTVDSGKVAMNVQSSVDPNIRTLTGLAMGLSPDEVEPAELLSATGVLVPGTANDDGKRANFTNIQASHVVPTEDAEVYRIRTGFERVMAHRTTPPFAYTAKDNGLITAHNTEAQMVEVTYKDGTVESFHYGDDMTKNPGQGFDIAQRMDLSKELPVGTRFKKGDVLAHNPSFFKIDPVTGQADYCLGVTENVALVENDITIEDSSAITSRLAGRLGFSTVHTRDVIIPAGTTVHEYAGAGKELDSTDALMVFDEADVPEEMMKGYDPEIIEMLEDFDRATPRAKYSGEVMKAEAYHTVKIQDMSESVKNMIDDIRSIENSKSDFSANSENRSEFPRHDTLPANSKIGIASLDSGMILVRFYIRHTSHMGGGSKVIYSSSLKSVVGDVMNYPVTGSDDGVEIGAFTSFRGINNRIVFGVILTGLSARVLESLEKKIRDQIPE